MTKKCCENCDEELTKVELMAMKEEQADTWCCAECYGSEGEGYTEHGKYIVLLTYVKHLARKSYFSVHKSASDVLNKIGEKY